MKILLCAALLWTLLAGALAEESVRALLDRTGYDRLEQMAEETGAKAIADFLLSPDKHLNGDETQRLLRRLGASVRDGLLEALTALAAPVLASLCLRLILGREDGALMMLCRLACARELARRCAGAMEIARRAMAAAASVAQNAAPVLSAALTVTGSPSLGASLSPVSSLCVGAIEQALATVGLPLCALAAIVCATGALSDHLRLDGLFSLLKKTAMWGVRLLLGGFVALWALEGRLASARDSASVRVLGRALRGMIPYVGGSVSDSTGALLESAAAVRGTVGVTGMALAAAVCLRPVERLIAGMLSMKLAAAVVEPVADPGIARLASGFADVAGMLVALTASSVVLVALLAGACLGFG